jgi:hypothetical protein
MCRGQFFAGTYFGGGVFRSTNNGGAWLEKNSGLIATDVRALATLVGHHSPNGSELSVLFAGTYGIGMCRSFDNGQTWEKINSGLTARYETCLASSSRDIFVGADFVNGAGG